MRASLPWALIALQAACGGYRIADAHDRLPWRETETDASSTGDASTGTDDASGSGTEDPDDPATTDASTDPDPDGATTGGATTGDPTSGSPPVDRPPRILELKPPAGVNAAGAYAVTVETTPDATSVRLFHDEDDLGPLTGAAGHFAGEIVYRGEADNGPHTVRVVATDAAGQTGEATAEVVVAAPQASTAKWSHEVAGPAASSAQAVTFTPNGDVVAISTQTWPEGPRMTVTRLSRTNGEVLWSRPFGTAETRGRAGAAAPDGTIWAVGAEVVQDSERPYVVHLSDGGDLLFDATGLTGERTAGVAADEASGCVVASTLEVGDDDDITATRYSSAHEIAWTMKPWDHMPDGEAHKFRDRAADVVIDGEHAIVVGHSLGNHDGEPLSHARSVVLRVTLQGAAVADPPFIAPEIDGFRHNYIHAVSRERVGSGYLTAGMVCDPICAEGRMHLRQFDGTGKEVLQRVVGGPGEVGAAHGVERDFWGGIVVAGAAVADLDASTAFVVQRLDPNDDYMPSWTVVYDAAGTDGAFGLASDVGGLLAACGIRAGGGPTQAFVVTIHPGT